MRKVVRTRAWSWGRLALSLTVWGLIVWAIGKQLIGG